MTRGHVIERNASQAIGSRRKACTMRAGRDGDPRVSCMGSDRKAGTFRAAPGKEGMSSAGLVGGLWTALSQHGVTGPTETESDPVAGRELETLAGDGVPST